MNRIPTLATASALALALALAATDAVAQSQTAAGSITIERALTVNALRPMAFKAAGGSIDPVSSGVVTEAIVEITGDPGRLYRVTLPRSIDADLIGSTIDAFTLRSENSGDITETLTARINAEGSDRLHIGGRFRGEPGLMATGDVAAIAMTITYE